MLELYIFNKEASSKNGLSYWDENLASKALQNTISFNLDRFKAKDSTQHLLTELAQELSYLYKETDTLKVFFENLGTSHLNIELQDDYHHLLCYDSKTSTLILDSKITTQLMPLYLWAVYYSISRQSKSEDQIYSQMFDFFTRFDFRAIDSAIKYLERDRNSTRTYDAGGHLLDYLHKIYDRIINKQIQSRKQLEQDLIATQLLRNRALIGALPFDLKAFEAISTKYIKDAFSGEACQEYFEVFKQSFDKKFAEKYYKHLVQSLKTIGLGLIAQRGSRVAHEQGPLLINSGFIEVSSEFEIKIRKVRSSTIETISKLEDTSSKFFRLNLDTNQEAELNPAFKNKIAAILLEINLNLDNFLYLCTLKTPPQARFEKGLLEFKKNIDSYCSSLLNEAQKVRVSKDSYLHFYDAVRIFEKQLISIAFDLEDLFKSSPVTKHKAVVYVQRPSSRSGHFIPRILMGQNLYIETDEESEVHRLNAIPYNFVVPEFDFIADGIDAFFENASISVVTDRKTGKPDIKWENAEDLAISLAPGMYRAIKAAQDQGSKFHYQLETTLFGPLIEIFLAILENEISNIASIETDALHKNQLNLHTLLDSSDIKLEFHPELAAVLRSYRSEVMEAANFVFKYYLLEDEVQNYMLQEGLDKEEAVFEMVLNLRDVQKDIAKYCLLKRKDKALFSQIFAKLTEINNDANLSHLTRAEMISKELDQHSSNTDAKIFSKKYIRYPESTARKEFLAANTKIRRINITSNKAIKNADYYFDLTVAPSRIDFGKHVVASITTMMGRMLGANDKEALAKGKEYIDYVSKATNSLFETAAEAGSVKVIENTCRAIQYSKAIAFQGVFQSFAIDGALARMTINARDTKAAGIHIMEYGTMASTGYCITKEPLFILLGLAINSDTLLDQLGVESKTAREELKQLMQEVLGSRKNFSSDLEWQIHIYEEFNESKVIQKYLANPEYKWLPSLSSMVALFKYISDQDDLDAAMAHTYSQLASKLIEFARIINETGIIQRVQLMNSAIRRAKNRLRTDKSYADLRIALNAAYKGNVSDERENANQYIMAFLLQQKQYLKNASMPEVEKLIEHQCKNYSLPREIRIFDPLVDPDIFMGGELKARADSCIQELSTLEFKHPLDAEIIKACVVSYGSNLNEWRILNKRLKELDQETATRIKTKLETLTASVKYLETHTKGFYKDPIIGYQGIDVIQLNANHDELIKLLEDLVQLKNIMRTGNENSLLVLIDNPQQAKRPFLDYDKALEWIALGGTIASHLISEEVYDRWRKEIEESSAWAKLFIQKLIYKEKLSLAEQEANQDYKALEAKVEESFTEIKRFADLKRDLVIQKFSEAKEMEVSHKTLKRYSEWIQTLARISHYQNISEITFNDWLILGGRWVLNGQAKSDINYVVGLFEKSAELRNLGKRGFELIDLFIRPDMPLEIEAKVRILENAGSTKEADLLVSSAADSLEYRAKLSQNSQGILLRMQEFGKYQSPRGIEELNKAWDRLIIDYIDKLRAKGSKAELNTLLGRLLKILQSYSEELASLDSDLLNITNEFIKIKEADNLSLINIFGDHRKHGGVFQRIAANAKDLTPVSKLGELFIDCYLIMLSLGLEDENETINKLATFFDQYLNVHEEDYPPYMFHSLCAGASYGFTQTYYLDTNLRAKMFKLACKAGLHSYKIVHYLLSQKSILKHSSQEYRDLVLGDYDNGMIPIGYQHEGICIEERFWDCMRALRNFVRNYHDKHPLPVVLKSQDATVTKLFRYKLADQVKLAWIAGLSNIGKHSWDLNCVLRSPLLRERPKREAKSGLEYINVSVFTPYLTNNGEIKQIYTSFIPEILEEQKLNYIAPFDKDSKEVPMNAFKGHNGAYILNEEGFVHALVNLDPELNAGHQLILPKPSILMSAHTHPQYINGFTLDLKIPEVWSMLSMQQMYAKTEVPKILDEIKMEPLLQIEFYEKEFNSSEELALALDSRLKAKDCAHIDFWLLKASRDSGGRGISNRMNLSLDRAEIIDFIFNKTRTDDVVMQEFVPNNARAFIKPEFATKVEDAFIDSGIAIDRSTPYEQIYFATRSFQSITGIKGYLFSANIGSVTVNAGQGAKMFYGEPIYIMPLYIASKVQKLLDEQGELILKEAIPRHAAKFAERNSLPVVTNNIGSNNCFMLNGLFDYIPFIFVQRDGKKYKVHCEDNSQGGLDYYYSYAGKRIMLASGVNHKASLDAIEQVLKDSANGDYQGPEELIDIDLAKIEFNSGLGQANLLQRAIEDMAPQNKDLFLEWTEDLGMVGIASALATNPI